MDVKEPLVSFRAIGLESKKGSRMSQTTMRLSCFAMRLAIIRPRTHPSISSDAQNAS